MFGASNWLRAPLPLNRQVILSPDRDAPGSPAELAFRRAVDRHREAGVTMAIAPAPEPEGSKNDLNDTLRRLGPDAVRDAVGNARPVTADWPRSTDGEDRQ